MDAARLLRKLAGPAEPRVVAAGAIRPLSSARTRIRQRQAWTTRTRRLPACPRFTHHTGAGNQTAAIGERAHVADLPRRAVRVRLAAAALSAGTAVAGRPACLASLASAAGARLATACGAPAARRACR